MKKPPRFGGMKTYNWEGVNPDGYFLDKLEPIPSALPSFQKLFQVSAKIGRAVQQECRDRSRMPSSARKKKYCETVAVERRQKICRSAGPGSVNFIGT